MAISDPGNGNEPFHRVLEAAAVIFAEEGFAGARVDSIAERAGVNKAMVYYHVGDKACLYETVFSDALDHARTALETSFQEAKTPEERVRAFIATVTRVAREHPHLPMLVLREFAGGGKGLSEVVLRKIGGVFRFVKQALEDGLADATFRPVNPLVTHLVIAGSVMFLTASHPIMKRVAELEGIPSPAQPPEDLCGTLSDLLLEGLRPPCSGPSFEKLRRAGQRTGRDAKSAPGTRKDQYKEMP